MKNKNAWLLAGILLLAAGLRLFGLGVGDLATDEAKTALGIAYPHSWLLPTLSVCSQQLFGAAVWAVRLPFALLGTAVVGLFYVLGKKYSASFSLLLAALATSSVPAVIFGRTAFLDTTLTFIWLLVLLAWDKSDADLTQTNASVWLFIVLALTPWFKLQGIYMHLAIGLTILWQTKGRFWQDQRVWLLPVSLLPIGLYVLGQPQQLNDIYQYIFKQSAGVVGIQGSNQFLQQAWLWYGPLLVLVISGAWHLWRTQEKKSELALIISLLGCLVLFFSVLGTGQAYYVPMLDIPVLFFSAFGLWHAGKSPWNGRKSILLALISASSLYTIYAESTLNPAYCAQSGRCVWNQEISTIKKITDRELTGPDIFLDDLFGYTPKWLWSGTTYKLDYLPQYLTTHKTAVVVESNRNSRVFTGAILYEDDVLRVIRVAH